MSDVERADRRAGTRTAPEREVAARAAGAPPRTPPGTELRRTRAALVVVGVVLAGYGGVALRNSTGPAALWSVARWFVAGPVLHDAVLAPAVVLVGAVLTRCAPGPARAYLQAGLVVSGGVLLVAAPVLSGRSGGADRSAALTHHYVAGTAVTLGAVWLAVLACAITHHATTRRRPRGDT